MAQPSSDAPVPNPRSQPSLDSYSLPPGPNNQPEENVPQGPVDAEIPIARPPVVTPRTAPATAPPRPGIGAVAPVASDSGNRQAQQPVGRSPVRPEVTEVISPPKTDPPIENPAATIDEPIDATDVLAREADASPPPQEARSEPVSATAGNDWYLLLVATLFFVLLGAMYLWRARRLSRKRSAAAKADGPATRKTGAVAKPPELPQPAPAVTIGFQPRSANATLFNAVVGFELTLSNPGSEILTDIRITGAMVQAGEGGTRNPLSADLLPLATVLDLQTGETETIDTEFRIPLASIQPIMFRSQALFVPLVQLSIEFTDGTGFRHFQTAAYLVGQEHQPPRQKMAPFRLDLGPRGFAPLGHRPLTAG